MLCVLCVCWSTREVCLLTTTPSHPRPHALCPFLRMPVYICSTSSGGMSGGLPEASFKQDSSLVK